MNSILNFEIILPMAFIFLCVFIALFFCKWYLKRLKVLSYPIGGLEWSQIIFAASIFSGCLIILSTIVNPIFQTYKTYISQNLSFSILLSSSIAKFTEIFLTTLIAIILYAGLTKVTSIVIKDKQNADEEIKTGNIPVSILLSSISIGLSILVKAIMSEVLIFVVPFIINYN